MVVFITLLTELILNLYGGIKKVKMESMVLLARRLNTSIMMKPSIKNGKIYYNYSDIFIPAAF
jgi:hypothetical protein